MAKYIRPIGFLKTWIAVEAVVDAWYCGSPHQYNNAKVVKLVTELLNIWTVVSNYVIARSDNSVLKIDLQWFKVDLTWQRGKSRLKRRKRMWKKPQCLPQLLVDNASTKPDRCK